MGPGRLNSFQDPSWYLAKSWKVVMLGVGERLFRLIKRIKDAYLNLCPEAQLYSGWFVVDEDRSAL